MMQAEKIDVGAMNALKGAVIERAADDARYLAGKGWQGSQQGIAAGLSAAAFFLSPFGEDMVGSLVGAAGIHAGHRLAHEALAAVGLTPAQLAAVSPQEWQYAIEAGRIPAKLLRAQRLAA